MPGRSRRRAGSVPEGGTQASRPRDGWGALTSASHRVQAPGSSQRTRVETQGKARHTAETLQGTAPRKAKPAPPRRLRQAAQYGETCEQGGIRHRGGPGVHTLTHGPRRPVGACGPASRGEGLQRTESEAGGNLDLVDERVRAASANERRDLRDAVTSRRNAESVQRTTRALRAAKGP